jgi:hypothetical protein
VFIVGCVAAIVLQYATRRVWIARSILLAVPIVMALSVVMYDRSSLVDRAYGKAGTPMPISIRFAPTSAHPAKTNLWDGTEHIYLPVHYAGIPDGQAIFEDDVRFTITAADGRRWSSPWQAGSDHLLPDQADGTLQLNMKPDVYKQFQSGPVTLQISFAMTRYQADWVRQMAYPSADAAIPGVGFCTPKSYQEPNLVCRAAIDGPRLTHVAAMWAKSGCSDPSHLFEPTAKGSAWIGSPGFDTHLATVWTQNLFLSVQQTDEERRQNLPWQICPGSPLTLTTYHWFGAGEVELTLTNFVLPVDSHWE